MNKILKLSILVTVGVIYLSSCMKTKFDEPEKATYNPGLTATTTIADLIDLYEEGLTLLDTNIIICGTVIANDKTGNFYKQIVIQDSTAGIAIDIDLYELHNLYHIGDLVYIKCDSLYLGQYGEVTKLGSNFEGEIGRISKDDVFDHIFKSDGGVPIKPKELNLGAVNTNLLNELVVIKNAQFSLNAIGHTYADGEYSTDGEYTIEYCDGTSMLVRTSGYADFARDSIPFGNGQMVAVLGSYNGEWQLMIRDPKEVKFSGDRCGPIFLESFDGGLGSFTGYSVIGDQAWRYDSEWDCASMSGYASGAHQNEDWLISQALDFTQYQNINLNFRHTFGYYYSGIQNDLKVYICDDFDGVNPASGTWVELTGFNYPANNSHFSWIGSGDINISAFGGKENVYIAFRYTSSNSESGTWEIDAVSVSEP